MNPNQSLTFVIITFLMIIPGAQTHADEATFDEGMKEVAAHIEKSDWEDAQSSLLELLRDHAEKPYVLDRLLDVQEDYRRCSLRIAVPAPHPKDLVSGDLQKYQRVSGDIRLVYEPHKLQDFEKNDGLYQHPLTFVGPYTIRLEGDEYPLDVKVQPQVIICSTQESCLTAFFGGKHLMATLSRSTQHDSRLIEKTAEHLPEEKKKFALEVHVKSKSVTMKSQRRTLMNVEKEEDLYGSFGLVNIQGVDKIIVSGKAHTSWFHGLVDAATREKEQEWLASHDPLEGLPDWAQVSNQPESTESADEEASRLPWLMTQEQISAFQEVANLLVAQEIEAAVRAYNRNGGRIPKQPCAYLLLLLNVQLGQWRKALVIAEDLYDLPPRSEDATHVYAELLMESGDYEKARKLIAELLQGGYDALESKVRLDLLENRKDETREFLRSRRASLDAGRFRDYELSLVNAERGPVFERSFNEEREHCVVVSDIDARVTRQAAGTLENQRKLLDEYFGAPGQEIPKAKVFLFSGETRYQSYARSVFDAESHSTAGMYSPILKQLLVWNLHEPGAIDATLRHEGIHQYFDQRGAHVPMWMSEGFAEYGSYILEDERGNQSFGEVSRMKILQLRQIRSLIPLHDFVEMNRERFYLQSGITYPMAWGLVHFLHHGPEKWRPIKDKAVAMIQKGCTKSRFMEDVFKGVDFSAMEIDYYEYLDEVRRR